MFSYEIDDVDDDHVVILYLMEWIFGETQYYCLKRSFRKSEEYKNDVHFEIFMLAEVISYYILL